MAKGKRFLYGFNNHKYVILYAFYLNMTGNTYLNRFYTKITDRHTKFYRNGPKNNNPVP